MDEDDEDSASGRVSALQALETENQPGAIDSCMYTDHSLNLYHALVNRHGFS
jgi:hypothetical protein